MPGDKDPWHLHADRIVVGLDLWPLLTGRARPRGLRVEGDVSHREHTVKVVAALDDISRYGQPDAISDGKLDLDWGSTRASMRGKFPLQVQLRGAAVTAQLDSTSLNDMLSFFGIVRQRPTASARASFELRGTEGHIELRNVDAALGKHRLIGRTLISTSGPRPVIDTEFQIEQLDWAHALLDTGDAPVAPLPPDELFYDRPIAWPLLIALQGTMGTISAQLGSLRLRNGVEMRHVKASGIFDDDHLQINHFTTDLLGGSATGSMRFDGRKTMAGINVEGKSLLLERWFKERSSTVPFVQGPMKISASLNATGHSMRDLAKSMTGQVKIHMGPGIYASLEAGDAEATMVAFSKKNSVGRIDFECAGADLAFRDGRATGNSIVGARSNVSRLLASGYVSMREEAADFRGRVQPKPGIGVGLAAIAGDIRIAGKLRAMKVTLDPAATPKVAARAGAAVLSLGLSLAETAIANETREDSDPCLAVFRTATTGR